MSGQRLLVFDVNETLSDMTPLRERFREAGAPAELMPAWFAGVLRDGFALTAAGGYADFADLARDGLRGLLAELPGLHGDIEAAADHVMAGFAELPVHPDVPEGVRALSAAGFRMVTMTNGSAALTGTLLERAGIGEHFEALLDVSGPRCWKPAPQAYRYVLEQTGVRPEQAVLVAVHPWDIEGARRAGLTGAWVRRGSPEPAYPRSMQAPLLSAEDLVDLADRLG